MMHLVRIYFAVASSDWFEIEALLLVLNITNKIWFVASSNSIQDQYVHKLQNARNCLFWVNQHCTCLLLDVQFDFFCGVSKPASLQWSSHNSNYYLPVPSLTLPNWTCFFHKLFSWTQKPFAVPRCDSWLYGFGWSTGGRQTRWGWLCVDGGRHLHRRQPTLTRFVLPLLACLFPCSVAVDCPPYESPLHYWPSSYSQLFCVVQSLVPQSLK